MGKTKKSTEVDRYIAGFPTKTQEYLEQVREVVLETAPDAEEVISYQMPAYKYNGMLVYFAGYKNHIGFYPTASGIEHFQKDIAKYKNSKGAVQFPLDEPLPVKLIARMTAFRLKENKSKEKKSKK